MTQIGVAMCMYLMIAYLKFRGKFDSSMQPIIRLLQLTYLSEETCGDDSIKEDPPDPIETQIQIQFTFS